MERADKKGASQDRPFLFFKPPSFLYNGPMQAVILAAGKGTRMQPLTDSIPKALIPIGGIPIVARTIQNLPKAVNQIVLVIGYLGEQVRAYFEANPGSIPITYLALTELNGTAAALWAAAPQLRDRFLVLNGDDLYRQDELERLVSHPLAFGIKAMAHPPGRYLHVAIHPDGTMEGLVHATPDQETVNVATGAYVLDRGILRFEPVRISNGELGLPHTIAAMAKSHAIWVEPMEHWFSLTSPEDLKRAEDIIHAF